MGEEVLPPSDSAFPVVAQEATHVPVAEAVAEKVEEAPVETESEKAPAEKIIEEASAAEQEEKLAEAIEHAEEKTVIENRELIPPIPATEEAAPFEEESYYIKDLKESEKKALLELKAKIAEAIKTNTFLAPPKPVATREVEVEEKKDEVEEKKEEKEEEMDDKEKDKIEAEEKKEEAEQTEGGKGEAPLQEIKDEKTAAPEEALCVAEVPVAAPVEAVKVGEGTTPEAPAEEEKQAVPDVLVQEESAPAGTDRDIALEEDDSPSLEDLSMWGVPLLPTKGDERTDVILLKFLRARDFKVNDAMSMLKDTVVWRKEFEADNLVEEEIATDYDSVAYMHGVDKEGHPVCYNHYGVFQDKELYQKTFGDEAQFKKFVRWRIQVLEKGLQKLDFSPSGVHSMVQVLDLKDSPGFVKRRNITRKVVDVLQDNYPELVAKQILINVPWYFGALYSLYGKFLTARSKSKFVVARPEKVTETLFKYIAPEKVPVRYGGFSRPEDTEFEGVEAPIKEVTLKAGERQTIELPVEEGGGNVVWDVVVVGWEVVYGEEFVPIGEGSYTVIIQKSKKVMAAEEPMRNYFKVTEPGKVVLTIENVTKRKKLVVYRHLIKKDAAVEC